MIVARGARRAVMGYRLMQFERSFTVACLLVGAISIVSLIVLALGATLVEHPRFDVNRHSSDDSPLSDRSTTFLPRLGRGTQRRGGIRTGCPVAVVLVCLHFSATAISPTT